MIWPICICMSRNTHGIAHCGRFRKGFRNSGKESERNWWTVFLEGVPDSEPPPNPPTRMYTRSDSARVRTFQRVSDSAQFCRASRIGAGELIAGVGSNSPRGAICSPIYQATVLRRRIKLLGITLRRSPPTAIPGVSPPLLWGLLSLSV